jgi:hypothetical protein
MSTVVTKDIDSLTETCLEAFIDLRKEDAARLNASYPRVMYPTGNPPVAFLP